MRFQTRSKENDNADLTAVSTRRAPYCTSLSRLASRCKGLSDMTKSRVVDTEGAGPSCSGAYCTLRMARATVLLGGEEREREIQSWDPTAEGLRLHGDRNYRDYRGCLRSSGWIPTTPQLPPSQTSVVWVSWWCVLVHVSQVAQGLKGDRRDGSGLSTDLFRTLASWFSALKAFTSNSTAQCWEGENTTQRKAGMLHNNNMHIDSF